MVTDKLFCNLDNQNETWNSETLHTHKFYEEVFFHTMRVDTGLYTHESKLSSSSKSHGMRFCYIPKFPIKLKKRKMYSYRWCLILIINFHIMHTIITKMYKVFRCLEFNLAITTNQYKLYLPINIFPNFPTELLRNNDLQLREVTARCVH